MDKPIKLMIIEDDPLQVELLISVLQFEEDYEVVGSATDGKSGIAIAKEKAPDIVLTGISMPGVYGFEVARKILEFAPKTKIIAITSVNDPVAIRNGIRLGMVDWLVKPYDIIDLFSSIRRAYIEKEVHAQEEKQFFISYTRNDWDEFVGPLIHRLRRNGLKMWTDQMLIYGGDDWLDSINDGLVHSDYLILFVSPEALESRIVKMEYRYFFIHEKPIFPVICREVVSLPAELQIIQHQTFDIEKLVTFFSLLD
jgi:CheY-like chemotaxis protein